MTEQQKNEHMLKEAFPSVEMAVVKAVLTASRGDIEAAFNALLGEVAAALHSETNLGLANASR